MPTLAEIMESEESLQKAAEDFVSFHQEQECQRNIQRSIEKDDGLTKDEFIAILEKIGTNNIDYKKLCDI